MAELSGRIIGAVGIVVLVIVLLAMTPTVVDQVQTMGTGSWNFTGYEGAQALLGLVPFVWVASILIAESRGCSPRCKTAVGMFALAKGKNT